MKKNYSGFTLVTVCVASIAVTLLGCFFYFSYKLGGKDTMNAALKFAAVYNTIDDKFVGDADMGDLSDIAYATMVQAIDDRWSYYMTSDQYKDYKQYRENNYTGIGVTIEKNEETGYFELKVVLDGSPAQEAGLKIGDTLKKINDEDLLGLETAEVKKLIQDQNGKDFVIAYTTAEGEDKTATVSEGVIHTAPVSYELLDNGVGYVKIKNFEGGCADGTIAGVKELIDSNAKGIVFDVRNNPGGTLQELLDILDYILPEGDIFVSLDEKGNEKVFTSDDSCVEIPMAVMVNQNTYSAAEFFAAALSEYDYATIVGSNTTGKARSQMNFKLGDGSAVHISTRSYLTPNRVDLAEQGGIVPDLKHDLSEEKENQLMGDELPYKDDEQMQMAVSAVISNNNN